MNNNINEKDRNKFFNDNYEIVINLVDTIMDYYKIDESLKEDVQSEAVIAYLEAIDLYFDKKDIDFKYFAITYIRDCILKKLSEYNKYKLVNENILYLDNDIASDVEDIFISKENSKIINKIVNGLSYEYRHLIILVFQKKKSLKEISNITGKTFNQIKFEYNKAIKQIKDELIIYNVIDIDIDVDVNNKTTHSLSKSDKCFIENTEYFKMLTKYMNKDEALISLLRIGFLPGKHYTTDSISKIFNISRDKVISISRRSLEIIKYESNLKYDFSTKDINTLNYEYLKLKHN